MKLLTRATLGASLLVAILLTINNGGNTVDATHGVQDGPNYVELSPDASMNGSPVTPNEYGLL